MRQPITKQYKSFYIPCIVLKEFEWLPDMIDALDVTGLVMKFKIHFGTGYSEGQKHRHTQFLKIGICF